MAGQTEDRMLSRADLADALRVSAETLRLWLKAGKLPKPDVALSRKTYLWRLSSLRAAGINVI